MVVWVLPDLVTVDGEVCSAAVEVVIVAEISGFCHASGIAVSLSCGVHAVVKMLDWAGLVTQNLITVRRDG